MKNRYIFDCQKLHTHEIPVNYQAEFHWFYDTCYDVLSNRSDREIEELIIGIDRHITSKHRWICDEEMFQEPLLDAWLGAGLYPSRFHAITLQRLLSEAKTPQVCIPELGHMSALTWQECMGAALLSTILFAVTQEQYFKESPFVGSELGQFFGSIEGLIGQHAINGMELLTLIRALEGFDSYPQPIKEVKTTLAKNAASARWKPSRQIKQRYIKWFRDNSGNKSLFRGRKEAAEVFYGQLTDEEKNILGEPEVLIKALREHFKNPKKYN